MASDSQIVKLARAYVSLSIDSSRDPCDANLHNGACLAFEELREALGIPSLDDLDAADEREFPCECCDSDEEHEEFLREEQRAFLANPGEPPAHFTPEDIERALTAMNRANKVVK